MRRLLSFLLLSLAGCSHCDGPPSRPPAPKQERPVHVVLVGDTLLADGVQPLLDEKGYDYPLKKLKDAVAGHDLLVGNLEGPITTSALRMDPDKAYSYKAHPMTAEALERFGFDLFCLANNHALDFGLAGMRDTMRLLDEQGIRHFGAGENEARAVRGRIETVAGVRIGFLGFMESYGSYKYEYDYFADGDRPGVAKMGEATVRNAIFAMRPNVDVLIASFHWGKNYKDRRRSQIDMGRQAVDWGADLVVGHHPHVAQGVEVYKGVPILYSLGNFAFGTPGRFKKMDPLWAHGWVADAVIENGRLRHVDLLPIATDNKKIRYQPRPAKPEVLADLWALLNADTGTPLKEVNGRARVEAGAP